MSEFSNVVKRGVINLWKRGISRNKIAMVMCMDRYDVIDIISEYRIEKDEENRKNNYSMFDIIEQKNQDRFYFKKADKSISWQEGIKALIDGKIVGDAEHHWYVRKNQYGEFKYFNIDTYTFENGYLADDDITEGTWYLV